MEPRETDILIVGQGLAGTLLSWELRKKNASVLVIDNHHTDSSSMVSAGLLQPVTGPRLVLTPGFEEHYAIARDVYDELEAFFQQRLFHEADFTRVFHSPAELVYWSQPRRQKTNQPYIKSALEAGSLDGIYDPLGSVTFQKSGWCHLPRLLTLYRNLLKSDNALIEKPVNYADIQLRDNSVVWNNIRARRMIFCEGWQGQNNPWFKHLAFNNAKGEILTVELPGHAYPDRIFSGAKWICPAQSHFKAGSNFVWDQLNGQPTPEGKAEVLQGLKRLVKTPVNVIDHKAGVRPIFKDLKPRAELHPDHPQLGIFNGLGSKGVLMGPAFARLLAERL